LGYTTAWVHMPAILSVTDSSLLGCDAVLLGSRSCCWKECSAFSFSGQAVQDLPTNVKATYSSQCQKPLTLRHSVNIPEHWNPQLHSCEHLKTHINKHVHHSHDFLILISGFLTLYMYIGQSNRSFEKFCTSQFSASGFSNSFVIFEVSQIHHTQYLLLTLTDNLLCLQLHTLWSHFFLRAS
jgi:hypothetical protein